MRPPSRAIGSALSGIERQLLNSLDLANAQVTLTLSHGHRNKINAPKDDPSAFVTLSGLQSQLSNVRRVHPNVTAAGTMVSQTQSALTGIQTQLGAIRPNCSRDVNHTLLRRPAGQIANQNRRRHRSDQRTGRHKRRRPILAKRRASYGYSGRNNDQVADVLVLGRRAEGIQSPAASPPRPLMPN